MDQYKPSLTLEPETEAPAAPELKALDIEKETAAVKAAVDEGRISAERYNSYLGMLEEDTKFR